MLSQAEHDMVVIAAYEWRKGLAETDDSLENLQWLCVDLLRECGPFWPLVRIYACLLQKEASLISPSGAYEAGKRFGAAGAKPGRAWINYLSEIENSPAARTLRGSMQAVYRWLEGATGKRGLIKEFVQEYQWIFGPASVSVFFEAGYRASVSGALEDIK